MGKFPCWDCGGSGIKEVYKVRGIDGGICYTCGGSGKTNWPDKAAEVKGRCKHKNCAPAIALPGDGPKGLVFKKRCRNCDEMVDIPFEDVYDEATLHAWRGENEEVSDVQFIVDCVKGYTPEELMFMWDREDLYDFAKKLRVPNRSKMTKAQLAMAIEDEVSL
jgi:hypothetical protein